MGSRDVSIGDAQDQVERCVQPAQWWLSILARCGYVAKGVIYLLTGLLATLAAFHSRSTPPDSRGALEEILSQPYGRGLLGVVALGLASYAIWGLVQAVADTERKGTTAKGIALRLGYAGKGVLYASLAYSAVQLLSGFGSEANSEVTSKAWTARLLAQPLGRWLVGGIGIGILAFALSQFYSAYTARFLRKLKRQEMEEPTDKVALWCGRVGLIARGVVFSLIGGFLLQAALDVNANDARGLSGALRALEQPPSGPWLLGVVAFGLGAYGLYMFVLARYRRITL
jgi:hypothetical protein